MRLACGDTLKLSLPVDSREPDLRKAIASSTLMFDPQDELRLTDDNYAAIADGTPLRELARRRGEPIRISVTTDLQRVPPPGAVLLPADAGKTQATKGGTAAPPQRVTVPAAATPPTPQSTSQRTDYTSTPTRQWSSSRSPDYKESTTSCTAQEKPRSAERHAAQSRSSEGYGVAGTIAGVCVAAVVACIFPIPALVRGLLSIFSFGLLS